MKSVSKVIGSFLGCGVAASVGVGAIPALAEIPKAASAKKPPTKPTAPPLSGPGSLEGVWNNPSFKPYRTGPPVGALPELKTAEGDPIPLRAWAAKVADDRRHGSENGKPYANNSSKCLTNGMPSVMSPAPMLPIQILETPSQITVLFEEFTTFRIIHMNEKHPADPDPSFMGDSVGHWEGDTLVVDTVAISDKTPIRGVIPHSEDLHLVERLRRTSKDTMEDRITIDDPKTFTRTWTMVVPLKRIPGMRLQEYICENNRNNPDANGATGVQLKAPGQ